MQNTTAKELFDSQFKFKINQEVRHKGDNKHVMSSDMGLLVLSRTLEEQADDDGNVHFTRNYICRMIRFSGSGDLAKFKESELMTIIEYNERAVKEEEEREWIRDQMHQTKKEVYTSFGVKKDSEVYLVKDGQTDKTVIYKVTGFRQSEEGTVLHLRTLYGAERENKNTEVKSKSEFVVIEE